MKVKKHNTQFRIGIDLLGAETSSLKLLLSIFDLAKSLIEPVEFHCFGTEDLKKTFEQESAKNTPSIPIYFHTVSQTIEMDESPLQAIRQKKDSSLYKGLTFLLDEKIDSFVSAGNTGALVASSFLLLPKLPHVSRQALLALMPTKQSPIAILDLGATLSEKSSNLIDFAKLGYAFQKYRGISSPKIGLLNIGSEKVKGSAFLQEIYNNLQKVSDENPHFKFVGNVEAKEVFEGMVDVIVTDAFTGNVLLKTAEGITNFVFDTLESHIAKTDLDKVKQPLQDLQSFLHYAQSPGALLLGFDKVIIKCHSYCSTHSFSRAVLSAIGFVKSHLVDNLKTYLTF